MALQKTEAVVLKTHNWSESSRTVELFSRDFGKIAIVDKGGRRLTSKRGRLMPFGRMEITFYKSEKSARGYVSEAELLQAFSFGQEGTVGRLAFASAAAELLRNLLSEEEPHPHLYEYFLSYLKMAESVNKQALPALFLSFCLRVLSHLGYHPALETCAGCGSTLNSRQSGKGKFMFSPERGGVVCKACQSPGEYYIPLSQKDVQLLATLQCASLTEAAGRPIRYQDATRLIEALTALARYQTGAFTELKALEFLAKLDNSRRINNTSSE
ncbi:MAG: DNA repair protein RecO [Candidatus Zixiibacteriota bacterium]